MKTVRLYGLHALEAALAARRVCFRLYVLDGRLSPRLSAVRRGFEAMGVPVFEVNRSTLDRLSAGGVHQGVVAELEAEPATRGGNLTGWLHEAGEQEVMLVLDGVQDPHNLGACLRSAGAFGASGVVIPRHGAAPLNAAAVKAASGAAERVCLFTVPNLSRALREIREAGFWLVGLDPEAQRTLAEGSFTDRTALVLGGEGSGLRRLTREACQDLVRIPMQKTSGSLNVSVATGIALYALSEQRRHRAQVS